MRRLTTTGLLLAALCAAPALHAQSVVCSLTILSWSLSNPEYASTCNCSNGENAMPVCGGGGAAGGAGITSFFDYGKVSLLHWETGEPFLTPHYSGAFAAQAKGVDLRDGIMAWLVARGEYTDIQFLNWLADWFYNLFMRLGHNNPDEAVSILDFIRVNYATARYGTLLQKLEEIYDYPEGQLRTEYSQTFGNNRVDLGCAARPGKSIPPVFGLYYNSLYGGQSESAALKIEQFPDGRAVFTDPDNVRWTFRPHKAGSAGDYYRSPPGSPYRLALNKRGFRVETPEGDSIDFSPAPEPGDWRPGRYNSADGSWLTYSYGPNGLARITDMHGRYFAFERDARGLPLAVIDELGRKTVFAYDQQGRATGVAYPDGSGKTFGYNAAGFLSSVKNGSLAGKHYTYDVAGRVLTSESDGGVNREEHYYNDAASKTAITDGLGHRTEYSYVVDHGQKLITGITDALGGKAAMSYGGNFSLASASDQLGRTTKYVLNSNGDPETVVDALGSTTTIQYQVKRNYRDEYGERIDYYTRPIKITDALGRATRLDYDSYGNLAHAEDALGNKTRMAYDRAGHMLELRDALGSAYKYEYANGLSRAIDPLGRATRYERDADLHVTKLIDPLGRNTTFTYDLSGNVTSVTNPQGFVTKFAYGNGACPSCGGSRLSALADPKGNTWTFGYDQYGRLTDTANPLGQKKAYQYDKMSRVTEVKDPVGNIASYTFDALSRLTRRDIRTPAGEHSITDYAYDAVGNLLSASNASSSVNFVYDALNRAVETTQAFDGKSHTIGYAFDAVGNRTAMTTPWGEYSYTYDALNRVISIVSPQGIVVSFSYDAVGRRTKKAVFKSTPEILAETSYAYDAAGQLLSIVNKAGGKVVAFANYKYDAAGSRIQKEDQDGTTKYRYDASNRLITAEPVPMNMAEAEVFIYDRNGNRRYDKGAWDYKYDAANRLLENSTYTYTHDLNGNLTGRAKKDDNSTISYAYNPEQQLSEVVTPEHKALYKYDPLGRRIEKAVDGDLQRYVYDNEDIVAILDARNTLTETFTHGPGIDEPLIMTKADGKNYYYHADGLGSIRAITDDASRVVETYHYKAYGAPTIKNAREHLISNSTIGNILMFAAREYELESDLYNNRRRYLDTRRGAFTQEDPIGFMSGVVNLYAYVGNAPTIYTDPNGEDIVYLDWKIHAGVGIGNDRDGYKVFDFVPSVSEFMAVVPTLPFVGNDVIYGNPVLGNIFFNVPGEVKSRDFKNLAGVISGRIVATKKEDILLSKFAEEFSKDWGTYNVATNNCRDFAQGLYGYLKTIHNP